MPRPHLVQGIFIELCRCHEVLCRVLLVAALQELGHLHTFNVYRRH